MQLENVVVDSADPRRLGRFWTAALVATPLTDEPGIYETRLSIPDGPTLDLCFQPVPEPVRPSPRLHLDLFGGPEQAAVVDRLLAVGARPLDIGQGDVPWSVLADAEGNPFCVMDDRAIYEGTGPIAGLPLDSADPSRDAAFWAWLTGWTPASDTPTTLRHPSGRGPLLQLCDEVTPKTAAKNRLHLDVRLEPSEDADGVAAEIVGRGGREVTAADVPWRSYQDPSGNEFCVLPIPADGPG